MDALKKSAFMKFILVVLASLLLAGCDQSGSMVVAQGAVEVYQTFPKSEPGNKVVAVLRPGQSAKVISTRHSKEFMFYKIRLSDGREGYVMFGDDFRVEAALDKGR